MSVTELRVAGLRQWTKSGGELLLVALSAVIGLPHEELGNQVHAIVQPRPGLDLDELKRHLAERLVIYKQPRSFELVDENVRDDAGKVRRTALRDARVKKA